DVSSSVSRETSTLSNAVARGRQAVQDQCDRLGLDATVVHGPLGGTYRFLPNLPPECPVTVVMPTRAEGGGSRPYRLAAAATMAALSTTHPETRLGARYPSSLPAELLALLEDAAGDRWSLAPVS